MKDNAREACIHQAAITRHAVFAGVPYCAVADMLILQMHGQTF